MEFLLNSVLHTVHPSFERIPKPKILEFLPNSARISTHTKLEHFRIPFYIQRTQCIQRIWKHTKLEFVSSSASCTVHPTFWNNLKTYNIKFYSEFRFTHWNSVSYISGFTPPKILKLFACCIPQYSDTIWLMNSSLAITEICLRSSFREKPKFWFRHAKTVQICLCM